MTEVRSRPKRKETKPGPKSLKLIRIYCGHVGHTQEHSHTHTHTLFVTEINGGDMDVDVDVDRQTGHSTKLN